MIEEVYPIAGTSGDDFSRPALTNPRG